MSKFITICTLIACCAVGTSQTIESAGGKWQKTTVINKLTGETNTVYSLDAEAPAPDTGIERRPRIAFSCRRSGKFGSVLIYTGTVIENQSHYISDSSSGWVKVSYRSDDQKVQTRPADIAKDGSTLLADKGIISDFVAYKKIVIQFPSASGYMVTDEYLTEGLSVESLKADCPTLFKR